MPGIPALIGNSDWNLAPALSASPPAVFDDGQLQARRNDSPSPALHQSKKRLLTAAPPLAGDQQSCVSSLTTRGSIAPPAHQGPS